MSKKLSPFWAINECVPSPVNTWEGLIQDISLKKEGLKRMDKHYPTIKKTIWLLVFLLLIMIFFGSLMIAISMVTGLVKSSQGAYIFSNYPLLLGILNLLSIVFIIIWGYKKTKVPFQQVFPTKSVPIFTLVPIIFTIIGLSILLSDVDNLLRIIIHSPVNPNHLLNRLINGNPWWSSLVILAIIAPFTEEFLFRGLILTGFLNNYSAKKAILISALLFAIFHLNMFQFLGAFALGLFFAWLVVKTKSLWPGIFGHALNNGLPVIVQKLLKMKIPGYTIQYQSHTVMQPLWFDAIGLVLLGIGVWLFWPIVHEKLISPSELLREKIQVENLAIPETEISVESDIS